MKNNNELGEKLKEYRLKAFPGEGLRRVATKIDMDFTHLHRLESGQYVPNDETLMKILAAYNVKEPHEMLNVFHLTRYTPDYQRIVNKVIKDGNVLLAEVLYRKEKKKDK